MSEFNPDIPANRYAPETKGNKEDIKKLTVTLTVPIIGLPNSHESSPINNMINYRSTTSCTAMSENFHPDFPGTQSLIRSGGKIVLCIDA